MLAATTRRKAHSNQGSVGSHTVGHVDGGGHGFGVELLVLFLRVVNEMAVITRKMRERTYLGSTTSFELVGVLAKAFQTLDKMDNFSPISPMSAIDLSMIG